MSVKLPPEAKIGMVARLPDELWSKLDRVCSDVVEWDAREVVIRASQPVDQSALLLNGVMTRHIADKDGHRQMVALQVPGDFVDLHSLPLGRLDHDVSTITRSRAAIFPHDALKQIIAESEDDARALWALTMIDASIHRHWTFRLGRLRATAGMANFLSELALRNELNGRGDTKGFDLPLTQQELAEVCGLSPMHVHRVLRDLREGGLCSVKHGRVEILDRAGLVRTGNFDPQYLYLPWSSDPAS